MFKPETIRELQAKLDLKHVSKREGAGGKMLDYLEQWYVIEEANRIFGHDGWSRETIRLEVIGSHPFQDKYKKDKFAVAYRSTVRVTVGDVTREGSGFGNGQDVSELNAHELAMKEAESDAMKRAFMTFGYPFGLALYDKSRANVVENPFRNVTHKRTVCVEIKNALEGTGNVDELLDTWDKYKTELKYLQFSDTETDVEFYNQMVALGASRRKQFELMAVA